MPSNEALYTVKVQAESSQLDKLAGEVTALKNEQAIPIKADAALASQSVASLKQQTAALAQDAKIHIAVDSTQATAGLKGVGTDATNAKQKVKELESSFDSLKEKGKSVLSGIGAGFLAGGAAIGAEKSLDAAKESIKSQEDLKIALRQTGAEGGALNQKFTESEAISAALSDKYAKSKEELRAIGTEIAGLGGISGQQASKVAEIGLAFEQVGIPAKALKAVIRGAADPESAAALDALKSKFPALTSALNSSTDAGGKMDAIYKALGPTLAGMKDAADGPLGSMDRMEQSGKQLEIGFGSLIFGVLTPFVPIVSALGSAINTFVVEPMQSATKFIEDNKTAVGILAVGVGILTLALNASAGATLAVTIAEKGHAIATGVVTGAQTLLNAVMSANPIGLIIVVIAALAAGAIYLYQHVEPVHAAFDKVWTVLKATGAFIGGFVKTEMAALAKAFDGVGSVLHGIVTMNFDEVKKGVGQVSGAIGTGMSAGKSGVEAFKASINDSTKSLADQAIGSMAAGAAGKQAAEDAAAAQAKLTDEINKSIGAYQAEEKGVATNVTTAIGYVAVWRKALEDIKSSGSATVNGQTFGPEWIDTINKNIAGAIAGGKQWEAIKRADEARDKAAKQSIEPDKAANKDLLSLAKERADQAAKELEVTLRLDAAKKGLTFTSKDELAVERLRAETLQSEIDKAGLLQNKKYSLKANLELNQQQIKTLEVEAKVKLDAQKLQDDLNKSIESLTKKQIELGIVPRSEGVRIIEQQIDTLGQKLTVLRAQAIINIGDPQIATQINAVQEQVLGLYKEEADARAALDKETADNRVATMRDGFDKELVGLTATLKAEEELYATLEAHGIKLTDDQLARKAGIEAKYLSDASALRQKYAKQDAAVQIDIAKLATDAVGSLWAGFFEKKERISQADADLQRLDFTNSERDLTRALLRGEISQKEYSVKLKKIQQDRADYEKKVEGDKYAFLKKASNDTYNYLEQDIQKYLQAELKAGIDSMVMSNDVARGKISDTADATAANKGLKQTQVGDDLKAANSTIIGAVATTIAKYTTSLPPIVGTALGLAAGIALMAGFKGLESAVGFERGGVIVGENGPEVISPAKEFSQFASTLVTNTVKVLRQSLNTNQGGRNFGGRFGVDVRGKLVQKGRDVTYQLQRDELSRKTEQMVPV